MKLSQCAAWLNVPFDANDIDVRSFVMDTQQVSQGDVFIALRGKNTDGHAYVVDAVAAGAAAVIVESAQHVPLGVPALIVNDTREAWCKMGAWARHRMDGQVVGITGSCGKTTTRQILQGICELAGPTLASIRSYNNDIGVPATLLRYTGREQYVVQELGANHLGEIAVLSQILTPHIAVVTTIQDVHLEGFGSRDGVAQGKSEIFSGVEPGGVAVLNRDDPYYPFLQSQCEDLAQLSFGFDEQADIRALNVKEEACGQVQFDLKIWDRQHTIEWSMPGRYNIMNGLAAAAAAFALRIPLSIILKGLAAAKSEERRMIERKAQAGYTILDDSYNANPAATEVALETLLSWPGRRIAVLGGMAELGEHSESCHFKVGQVAKQKGIDALYCYGQETLAMHKGFGEQAYYFDQQEELIQALLAQSTVDDVYLIKGSFSTGMDAVVKALMENKECCYG